MANRNDLFDFDNTGNNNDNVAGANVAEGCAPSGINNAIRNLCSIVLRACGFKGSDIASASTTNIGAAGTALYQDITGTTTITALGTVAAGTLRWVQFDGALTLTHNATSLILPGGANITTAAGDVACFISEGSGNWRCLSYQKALGVPGVDLLDTKTASTSANLSFVLSSYTSTYRSFQFRVIGIRPATDGATLFIRTSTDGGSNYDSGASDYDWVINNLVASGNVVSADAADSEITTANVVGSAVAESIRGVVDLFLATSTSGSVQFNWNLGYCTTDGTLVLQNGVGRRAAAADIDAVRFLFDSGNITSGLIQLYGIR